MREIDGHAVGDACVGDILDLVRELRPALNKFLLELLHQRVGALLIPGFKRRTSVMGHRVSNHGDRPKNGQQDDKEQFGAEAHGSASILNEMAKRWMQKPGKTVFCGEHSNLSEMIPRL